MIIDWNSCSDGTGANAVATLSCIPLILSSIVYWALVFAGIIAIFIVIFAGFKYINSGGDPKQADTARKTLLYAIFGLLLIFMSFFIIKTVGYFTNVSCINTFGFNNCDTGATPNSE